MNGMSIANNDCVLEFLDLTLHVKEHNKICVDMFVKLLTVSQCFTNDLQFPKNIKFLKGLY